MYKISIFEKWRHSKEMKCTRTILAHRNVKILQQNSAFRSVIKKWLFIVCDKGKIIQLVNDQEVFFYHWDDWSKLILMYNWIFKHYWCHNVTKTEYYYPWYRSKRRMVKYSSELYFLTYICSCLSINGPCVFTNNPSLIIYIWDSSENVQHWLKCTCWLIRFFNILLLKHKIK